MKRRQFIQSMLLSTAATAVFVNLEKKTLAANFPIPSQPLYGVRATAGTVHLSSLDLTTNQVKDLSTTIPELTLQPNERLSGFTVLLDGTLVVATAPATISQHNSSTRLLSLSSSQTLPALQGIDQYSTVESLLATKDGQLLSVISLNHGTPPFRLATIDIKTGQVNFINQLSLPENQRFSNLAESPNGDLYATNISGEGSTKMVQLFLDQGNWTTLSQLSYNNKSMQNDLLSQAYSPLNSGTFALANPSYQSTNSLFWVNEDTGLMRRLTAFAVDKIAFGLS